MINLSSTVDIQELNKFAQHANIWWDCNGPLKTLHDINSIRLDFIARQVPLKGIKILDVGCGGGILSEALAQAGATVTGIDATYEAIQVAQEHANNNNLNIEYLCTPIEDFEGSLFDVITCMELLEHVPNPELVIEHCKRLLKPNGFLFLSTINRTIKAYLGAVIAAEYVLGILPRQTHEYQKFIRPSELSSFARSLELEFISLEGLSYNPLTREAKLSPDVSINYLMSFKKTMPIDSIINKI